MLINGKHYITIWLDKNNIVKAIDQTKLPHKFEIIDLVSTGDVIKAIKNMIVRGAPLIGVAAAYGIYLAAIESLKKPNPINYILTKSDEIKSTRPTAINLFSAVNTVLKAITGKFDIDEIISITKNYAIELSKIEIESCKKIGNYGLDELKKIISQNNLTKLNILTHCNAGWLACIDYGTAAAPIYFAKEEGIDIHVWVEETRPRNQGALLTAFELTQNNIPHTVITDNAGGYVMQKGMVDVVIVGSDRTTCSGDVCNKIGTYKTALAAKDNNIPFYAAVPSTSFDLSISDGINEIPIEERNPDEVKFSYGIDEDGRMTKVLTTNSSSPVKNYGFDITPSRLVTSLITDKGLILPNKESIIKAII